MSADEAAQTQKPKSAEAEKPAKGKKALPANCAQCNKRIRRKTWYYRNGKHFCGKPCAKKHMEKLQEDKAKAAAGAKEGEAAPETKAA